MSQFEPYWDTQKGHWPGLYDVGGKPINAGVVYDSHIGVWCDWMDLSGLGVVATDEFEFKENGQFVWLRLRGDKPRDYLVRLEGTWELDGDILRLCIHSTDDPEVSPRTRADFRIVHREECLQLSMSRLDDEVCENICSYRLLPAKAGDAARVLEKALEKRSPPPGSLPRPYSTLETLLKMAIPPAVKKLRTPETAFCMRIYYFDTHAPRDKYSFSFRVLGESLRRKLVAESSGAAQLEWELWHPLSGAANGIPCKQPGLYEVHLGDSKELTKYFEEVYDLLCDSEDDNMPLLRELARRLSKASNGRSWGPDFPITDDFVAFPADGSGFFGGEHLDDLVASVPGERVELLRQRGYLT